MKLTIYYDGQFWVGVIEHHKKVNPKRLQRQVSKELKIAGVTSKAQEVMKLEFEARKQKKKQLTKEQRENLKEKKEILKKQKAKKKHKGK